MKYRGNRKGGFDVIKNVGGFASNITGIFQLIILVLTVFGFVKGFRFLNKGILSSGVDGQKGGTGDNSENDISLVDYDPSFFSKSKIYLDDIIKSLDGYFSSFIDVKASKYFDLLESLNEDEWAYVFKGFGIRAYGINLPFNLGGGFYSKGNLYYQFNRHIQSDNVLSKLSEKTLKFVDKNLHYIPNKV